MRSKPEYINVITFIMRNTEQCAQILKKSDDPDCQALGRKYDGEVSAYYDVL